MDPSTYRFGPFAISRDEKLLRRSGEPVPLPPKAVETLLLLVQSAGQVVSKEDIIRAVWPDAVVEENNLTQQISLLRKALGNGGGGGTWIQTVPKRGYRFVPPEPEPEPVRAPVPAPVPETKKRTGLYIAAAAALLIIAAAATFIATRPAEIRSVAVLPIQPLTANDELSAIGLGVSDAVAQRLSYSRDLTVRPIASVRQYIGKAADPLKVGRELNVDAVIAGTIQRDGDRYRITMELVDVRSNRSRWSSKIEEKATDVFRMQDIVAESTLRSLPAGTRPQLPAASHPRGPRPEAYEAFLKGRYYWSRRNGDDVPRAIAEFERAVALDSTYAAAWAGLASAINIQSLHFVEQPEMSFRRSRSAARQAILLDPNLAEAHAALGFIAFYYDWNWAEGEAAFRRAIKLDPTNGNYHQLLSNVMVATGRRDEAVRQIQQGIRIDPASIMVRAVSARQLYLAGRYQESEEAARQALAMDSSFLPARTNLAVTLSAMGRHAEAAKELDEVMTRGHFPQSMIHRALVAAKAGDAPLARRLMREANEQARNGATFHYDAAAVYAHLGEPDAAFAELDRGIKARYSGMVWLNVDPRMEPIRSDPRFAAYVKRVGFPAS